MHIHIVGSTVPLHHTQINLLSLLLLFLLSENVYLVSGGHFKQWKGGAGWVVVENQTLALTDCAVRRSRVRRRTLTYSTTSGWPPCAGRFPDEQQIQKHFLSLYNRDSQLGCRGTQGCRELVPGVPPIVTIPLIFTLNKAARGGAKYLWN